MYIKIYPKTGEPYYFQKMIGKYAVKGTKNLKDATMFKTFKDSKKITDSLNLKFSLDYSLFEDVRDTDYLLRGF